MSKSFHWRSYFADKNETKRRVKRPKRLFHLNIQGKNMKHGRP